jgi:hypothetical protein
VVNQRLEDLHVFAGDLGAAHAAQQFFGFAAEHGAADQFDVSIMELLLHGMPSVHFGCISPHTARCTHSWYEIVQPLAAGAQSTSDL